MIKGIAVGLWGGVTNVCMHAWCENKNSYKCKFLMNKKNVILSLYKVAD